MINWTYVMITLLIRFVGVFLVLAILMLGIQAMSLIITRFFSSSAKGGEPSLAQETYPSEGEYGEGGPAGFTEALEESPGQETREHEVTAAITIALDQFLRERARPSFGASSSATGPHLAPSAWSTAGRMEQFRRRRIR